MPVPSGHMYITLIPGDGMKISWQLFRVDGYFDMTMTYLVVCNESTHQMYMNFVHSRKKIDHAIKESLAWFKSRRVTVIHEPENQWLRKL